MPILKLLRKKRMVIGNFGFSKNQMDGQTIKTRTIADSLEKVYPTEVIRIDIGGGVKAKISSLLLVLVYFVGSKEIFILPGENFLKFGCNPIIFLGKLFCKPVHYIVVGGWIKRYLKQRDVQNILARFDTVNAELKSLVDEIRPINQRTYWIPNYRDTNYRPAEKQIERMQKPLKLVFFSRVMREKGVFKAIEVTERLISSGVDCELGIYGPLCFIEDADLDRFEAKIGEKIQYKGVLEPGFDLYQKLSFGDLLIFPTTYQGEGFPGAVADAFVAGLPVIASDWAYNSEIVIDNYNGFIVEGDFVTEAEKIIRRIELHPKILIRLRENAIGDSMNYRESAFLGWLENVGL